jgi:hypothetical protein
MVAVLTATSVLLDLIPVRLPGVVERLSTTGDLGCEDGVRRLDAKDRRAICPGCGKIEQCNGPRDLSPFWWFGLVIDLPYSSKSPETGGFVSAVRPLIIIQTEEELQLNTSEY